MTRTQIKALIRKELGESTAAFWTDAELNTWIDNACDDLAFRAKCIRDNGKMTLTASTAEYVTSSFYPKLIAILEVYHYNNATTWYQLQPITRDELNREYPGWKSAAAGVPTHYYWDREEDMIGFYVKPNATNAGTDYVEVYYAKEHTDLAGDSSEPDIPLPLQPAIIDFVVATGLDSRGWGDKSNDKWQKFFTKIHDYQVERHREREDDDIIMRGYKNR